MPNDNEFKVKFDGRLHEVDAQTLINSLVNLSTLVQECNAEVNSGNKIDIKIKALQPGSFEVYLSLVTEIAEHLFSQKDNILTKENITVATAVISCVTGIIQVKKHLGSQPPAKVEEQGRDKILLENSHGKVILINTGTFNLYAHNQRVQDAVSSTFETLANDPNVTGFEIKNPEEETLVAVDREEFSDMAVKSEVIEEKKRTITEIATLHIFKLVFENKYKWEFYYKGNRISASIADPDFFGLIDQGERFAKGDTLSVELQITQVYDETVATYVNSTYQINKVLKHLPKGEQQKLDFE